MRSVYTIGLSLFISIASLAQDKDKGKSKDKDDKGSHTHHKNEGKVKEHERIIWAGTGIDLNDKSKDVKNIPDAVLASFRQYFPDQEIDGGAGQEETAGAIVQQRGIGGTKCCRDRSVALMPR